MMQEYLIVIEPTQTGFSAYSPIFLDAFPPAPPGRKSNKTYTKLSLFTSTPCAKGPINTSIMNVLEAIENTLLIAAGIWLFQTYRHKTRMVKDFDYCMQVIAEEAVKQAIPKQRTHLDFSPESIEFLDEMPGEIHESHLKHPLGEKELSLLSLRWGAYIGEAVKRVHPAKWQRDSERMGPGTTPLVYESGEQAFPRSWVYKRIVDGPMDSVTSSSMSFPTRSF
ncbi:MAG TPA: hypothetical protein VKH63_21485 [Candidatus Acidoferrum sp.]|nr:hypothetical protein [Candidatus Acidoferrum sp.]